mgnify:CR=1 FL=1
MTIRPIVITGEPVLHARAAEVTVFDEALVQLVRDMYETMDKAPGVGLAAPQIGVGLRVFVYNYDDDEGNPRRGEVINPIISYPEAVAFKNKYKYPFSETSLSFTTTIPIRIFQLSRKRPLGPSAIN